MIALVRMTLPADGQIALGFDRNPTHAALAGHRVIETRLRSYEEVTTRVISLGTDQRAR